MGTLAVRFLLGALLAAGFSPLLAARDNQAIVPPVLSRRPPDLTQMTLDDLRSRLSFLESSKGRSDPELIPVLRAIVVAYRAQGAYAEAIPFEEQGLTLAQKALGENDPEVVLSLDALGTLDLLAGDDKAAIENFEHAQFIVEKYLGAPHPMQALLLLHLGSAYLSGGRLNDAERALKRARPALVSAFGPETLEATAAEQQLGTLYLRMGQFSKAQKELEDAFAIRMGWLSNWPDNMTEAGIRICMAQVQVPLGALYTAEGRYEEANYRLLGALQTFENILGRDRPELEEALVNLAALAAAQGDDASASAYQIRAERIHKQSLGISHLRSVPLPQALGPLIAKKANQ